MSRIEMRNMKSSPSLPWRVKLCVYILALAMDLARSSYGFIWRRLINIADLKTSPSKNSINGVKTSDITIDAARNLWFRLYTPAAAAMNTNIPVIVYFHGGGFVFMAPNSIPCDDLCYRLARELPAIIISVNYRLAPEHRYPSQYEDGFDVLKFLDNLTSQEFPASIANLKHCFLAGDSAGANLAHHIAIRVSEHNNNFNCLQVKGLICIQPFFGGEERTESETRLTTVLNTNRTDWMWKSLLPDGSNRNHQAVNVFGPNSIDISRLYDFPETIVFIGGFDPLQDWQRRYCEGLKKSGKIVSVIEYPNAIHIFYVFPELPESGLMINSIREFIQKITN